jgi:hypothetical protein
MRPSAPQFEQVQTIVESRATAASTVFFRHLKHLGAACGCPVAFEACATTSAWNCAIALAGPFVGPIAPVASRKCLRSVMYIASVLGVQTSGHSGGQVGQSALAAGLSCMVRTRRQVWRDDAQGVASTPR